MTTPQEARALVESLGPYVDMISSVEKAAAMLTEYADMLERQAARAASAPAAPGWQLVPAEPTEAMRSAARYAYDQWGWSAADKLWTAMLAAAPKGPQP